MASTEKRQQSFHENRGRYLEELDMMVALFKSNCKGGEIKLAQTDMHICKYETIHDENGQSEVLTQDVIQKKDCLLKLAAKYTDLNKFR